MGDSYANAVTISHNLNDARDISRISRSHIGKKRGPTIGSFDPSTRNAAETPTHPSQKGVVLPEDLGVQVRIERTIQRTIHSQTFELEDYSRTTWRDRDSYGEVHPR